MTESLTTDESVEEKNELDLMTQIKSLTLRQRLLIYAMLFGSLVMMLPFWMMIVTSLIDKQAMYEFPPKLFPDRFHWENYGNLFSQVPMDIYFWNSLVVAVLTTVFHVLFCAMAGYAFSRLDFPAKNIIFFFFLITLMIPPQINIVPLFFLMKQFHWVNTYAGLIVPGLFGAFGVFLMRQWFNGLPKDLEDAARIDGCNPWMIFWKIALPLAKPALAALAIFVFIGSWNSFMWPLIITYEDSMRTLPVGIAALKSSHTDIIDWTVLMAASCLSVLPVIGIFLVGQKQFIRGILSGGVKE